MSFKLNYADFGPDYWGPVHCMSPVAKILEMGLEPLGSHEVGPYGE